MPKFIRKPIVVDAQRFNSFQGQANWPKGIFGAREHTFLMTPDGSVPVKHGDWVVTNAEGFQYKLAHYEFAALFQPVAA